MSEWKGLDPGGTEQLWDTEVLIEVLSIFKEYEPFSRGLKSSPIYRELKITHPNITWENTDANGEFRPIFRKTNPWIKLRLTTSQTEDAYVTPLGDELLSGEKSISDVFIDALKSYTEQDGEQSFAIMCNVGINLPSFIFTLEDVEYFISKTKNFTITNLKSGLQNRRAKGINFPVGSRRIRTLSSFMGALVSSGAFMKVNGGWMLADNSIAKEIAYNITSERNSYPLEINIPKIKLQDPQNRNFSDFKIINPGKRIIKPFNISLESDPIKRSLLLEKANSTHENMVELCANIIRTCGLTPIEDQNSFDVAVIEKNILIEIKSINENNSTSQFRKAIAQLPEYRWRHRKNFLGEVKQIIIIDKHPLLFFEKDFIEFVEIDRGILIFWKKYDNDFYNLENQSFSDFISSLPII